ncbi:hypothetical protein [Serratia proteamaculans]|uniref:hypothetical protein n=1 Tax=Serratia proteamaculans TaxID=28151 RepID=UPI0021BD8D66|nr:hypothetical protein [Serratia proteamaculans]
MDNLPKSAGSSTEVTGNDQVTGSVIYRRVDPEKKKALKKIIKDTAKKHGLVAHIFERK